MIRRREFIAGLGAAGWPIVARAQQPTMPVTGFLEFPGPVARSPGLFEAFRAGLAAGGFIAARTYRSNTVRLMAILGGWKI